ncbi:MAG: DoxX family protein [Chitinophagaceae bacterium]|nr:MAG: DoxX family protein [Chitinophagaceae bacterium]
MKRLMSIGYTTSAFNIAVFVLRVGTGLLVLLAHGYDKFVKFETLAPKFTNFLGMGRSLSLGLCVFAEVVCSLFVILGLFTRLACIPLVINFAVAVAIAHKYDFLHTGEKASLFFLIFLTILFVGPGRVSVDGMLKK